jgi:hypothetical protein
MTSYSSPELTFKFFKFWRYFNILFRVCVCFKESASEATVRDAAFIAFYIFISVDKAMQDLKNSGNVVNVSHCFNWLLKRDEEIINWIDGIGIESSLAASHWDSSEGKTTMGCGPWRIAEIDLQKAHQEKKNN